MCVDSWPTFTTAICYRQKQCSSSRSSSVAIPDICTVFTKNPATLKGLLLNERVVNRRSGLIFRGIPSSHCHLIKEPAFLSGGYNNSSTTAPRRWTGKNQECVAAANLHPGRVPR